MSTTGSRGDSVTFSNDSTMANSWTSTNSQPNTACILTVAPPAAVYFTRRKLVAQQVIEKQLEDGSLIVSGRFAHPNQILPLVRYWMPHVRIVSPAAWQEDLEIGLRGYLCRPNPIHTGTQAPQ